MPKRPDPAATEAKMVFGEAYDAITKSVFALVAWNLASTASAHDGGHGWLLVFAHALNELSDAGTITADQHRAASLAILTEMGR